MSDLTIPGVTSNIDTPKMVNALMDVERIPLTRMESDVDIHKRNKNIWQELNLGLSRLKDNANTLYSFNSPFAEKIAVSENETVLIATATRKAIEERKSILVKQMATADRFMSQSLDKDFRVEAGTYRFMVGDEEVEFTFEGGTLQDFADAINKKAGKLLKASVVNNTATTQVLIIEALKTGAKNILIFFDKAIDFGLESGMLKKVTTKSLEVKLTSSNIQKFENPLTPDMYAVKDGMLTVNPGTELQIPIRPPFILNENLILEYEVKTYVISEDDIEETQPPPGPEIPDAGSIEHKGIRIFSEKSKVLLPEWQAEELPEHIDDMGILFFKSEGKILPLPQISDSEDFQKVQVPIGKMADNLEALVIKNNNTHRYFYIRNINIIDPTTRGDYEPVNPLSRAGDAIIEMDGIEIVRDSNIIEDLIPEVTITLFGESDKPVKLSIEHDIELIKESIIAFVGSYNQLITQIDILTRNDEAIIDNALYMTEREREDAREKLGIFQGDLTLRQLKSHLQNIMMNPYKTAGGQELVLLAQIGISTSSNATGAGGAINKTLLRGYIQIDEAMLDEVLRNNPEWVKELFGNDLDGDLIIDSGVAHAIDFYLKPYLTTGGTIPTKISSIDSQIVRKEKEIADYQEHLVDYEAQLRRKYGMMEGMLDSLEKSSQQLDNFNKNNK